MLGVWGGSEVEKGHVHCYTHRNRCVPEQLRFGLQCSWNHKCQYFKRDENTMSTFSRLWHVSVGKSTLHVKGLLHETKEAKQDDA
eukprot:1443531-Amphidinium_carterae.3